MPGDFPVAIADRLRADGITLTVDDGVVAARRRVKEGAELQGIRAAQAAAHAATARASELLARAEVGSDGNLRGEDGAPLLAEQVREELRLTCAEHGATCPADMIVASIHNGGGGHDPGTGPLPAGLPIQVDIFPRHEASACWADMTRTFVVGDPAAEHAELISEQERLVRAALDQARRRDPPRRHRPRAARGHLRSVRSGWLGHAADRRRRRGLPVRAGARRRARGSRAAGPRLLRPRAVRRRRRHRDRAWPVGQAHRRRAPGGSAAGHPGRLRDADRLSLRARATRVSPGPSAGRLAPGPWACFSTSSSWPARR